METDPQHTPSADSTRSALEQYAPPPVEGESARKEAVQTLYRDMDREITFGRAERILPHLATIVESSGLPPGAILEVGCGNGVLTEAIGRAYPDRAITAIDLSPEQIAFAQTHHALPNITYQTGDADSLPAGPFALIATILMIQYLSDIPAFLRSAFTRLTTGGVLYYVTPALPVGEPERTAIRRIWQTFIWHTPSYGTLDEHLAMLRTAGFVPVPSEGTAYTVELTPRRKAIALEALAAYGLTPEQADAEGWLALGSFAGRKPDVS